MTTDLSFLPVQPGSKKPTTSEDLSFLSVQPGEKSVLSFLPDRKYPEYETPTPSGLLAGMGGAGGGLDRPQPSQTEDYDPWAGVEALGRGLVRLPGGIVDQVGAAWRGGEDEYKDRLHRSWEMRRDSHASETSDNVRVGPGFSERDVEQAMESLPFSLVSMGAAIPTGLAASVATPVAGWAAGMGAAGAMGYRQAKEAFVQQYFNVLNGVWNETAGMDIPEDVWNTRREAFEDAAQRYGLWEAIPEALGSGLGFAAIIGKLNRFLPKNVVARLAWQFGITMSEELATETITQHEQAAIEVEVGLRERAPGWAEAFKEVAPTTVLLTAIMGGGVKAGHATMQRIFTGPRQSEIYQAAVREAEESGLLEQMPDSALETKIDGIEGLLARRKKDEGLAGALDVLKRERETREAEGRSVLDRTELEQAPEAGEAATDLGEDVGEVLGTSEPTHARERAEAVLVGRFGEEQSRAVLNVMDGIADAWAETEGSTPGQWWETHLADIRESKAEDFQDGWLAQPMNPGVNADLELDVIDTDGRFLKEDPYAVRKDRQKLKEITQAATGKFRNLDQDQQIEVTKEAVKHVLKGERKITPHHVEAVIAIPHLIERAVLIESDVERKGREDVKQVHLYFAPLRIDGDIHIAKLTVLEFKDGTQSFDEAEFHRLHHQQLVKKIPGGPPTSSEVLNEGSAPGISKITIMQMLEGVKDRLKKVYFQAAETTGIKKGEERSTGPGQVPPGPQAPSKDGDESRTISSLEGNITPEEARGNLSPSDLSPILQALQDRAENALPFQVVQSHSDLPKDVRAETGPTAGAHYSQGHQTVWFIVDNIQSTAEAVGYWFHEQGGHHGVRRVLGEKYNAFMEDAAKSLGEEGLAEAARDYDLDLSSEADRFRAAEETVARIAEKIGAGVELTETERTVWEQFVAMFREALRGLGLAELTEAEIEDTVKLAVRGVMGRQEIGQAPDTLRQDNRGGVQFLEDGRAIIHLFEGGDASTVIHEVGHVLRRQLGDADRTSVEKWAGVITPGVWTREAEEKFAKAFERYVYEGRAPSQRMRLAFSKLKKWLVAVYHNIREVGAAEIPSDVRKVFDRLTTTEEERLEEERALKSMNPFRMDSSGLLMVEEEEPLPPGTIDDYASLQAEATRRAMSRADRRHKIEARERRKKFAPTLGREKMLRKLETEWRAEAKESFETDPTQTAIATIRGRGGISLKSLSGQTDKTTLQNLLRKRPGLVRKDSDMEPDILAREYGLEDTPTMIEAFLNAPTKEEFIRRHMEGRYNEWLRMEAEYESGLPAEQYDSEMQRLQAWRDEGRQRADAHRAHRAMDAARKKGGIQLERLLNIVDEATAAELNRKRPGLAKKGTGMWPEELALEFGYATPGEMIEDMLEVPTKARMVEAFVSEKMGKWDEEGVLNEDFADDYFAVLEEEQRILDELMGKTTRRVRREKVRAAMGRMFVGKIGGRIYPLERKLETLTKSVKDAFDSGNRDKAAELLREMQGTAEMLRELHRARHEINRIRTRALPYFMSRKIEPEYAQQLRHFLARFGLASDVPVEEPSLVRFLQLKSVFDFTDKSTVYGLAELTAVRPGDLTLDQLRDIHDMARQIVHFGDMDNKLQGAKAASVLHGTVKLVAETIQKNKPRFSKAKEDYHPLTGDPEPEPTDKLLKGLSKIHAWLVKPEFLLRAMDGYKDFGPVWSAIFERIKKAEDAELALGGKIQAELKEAFAPYLKKLSEWNKTLLTVPGLEKKTTKERLIMIALNSGNEGNRAALLSEKGLGLSEEQLQACLNMLSKEEWGLVNRVWEILDQLYEPLDQVERKLKGLPLKKVEGRYFPLVFDRKATDIVDMYASREENRDLMTSKWVRASTSHGHRMERTGGKYAPLLSFSVIDRHVSKAVYDATHALPVRDVQRIMSAPAFQNTVEQVWSVKHMDYLRAWLQDVAKPETPVTNDIERLFGRLRRGATVVALGLKISVAMKQTLSFTQTIDELGFIESLEGVRAFYKAPWPMMAWVNERSLAMANRRRKWDRDIANMYSVSDYRKDSIRNAWFSLIGLMDAAATYPTWLAAYKVGMDKHGWDETKAVEYADLVVRRTQPAGSPKDLAAVQRGSDLYRMFTMFYTFFSVFMNRFIELHGRTLVGQAGPLELFKSWAWVVIIPGLLGDIISKRDLPDEPEDVAKAVGGYIAGGFPVVRDMVGPIFSGYSYTMTPVQDAGTLASRTWNIATGEGEDKGWKLFKSGVMAAGYWWGLPSRQALITLEGMMDLGAGRTDDPFRLFFPEDKR